MITCQACGTQNPPGASYCSKCARKLDEATQQAVVEQRAAHTATALRWSTVVVTTIILVAILVVVALFATHVL